MKLLHFLCLIVLSSAINQEDVINSQDQERNLVPSFSNDQSCGQCIENGFVSCLKSDRHYKTLVDGLLVNELCLKSDGNSYNGKTGFICSDEYNNTLYSKYVCMYNQAMCGPQDYFKLSKNLTQLLANETQNEEIRINQMTKGSVCFYKIETSVGVANISLEKIDYANQIIVEYIDFETDLATEKLNSSLSKTQMVAKSETFLPTDGRNILQGRMFYTTGNHYWGNVSAGQNYRLAFNEEESKYTESQETNRTTYLIVTSLSNYKSDIVIKISQNLAIGSLYLKVCGIMVRGVKKNRVRCQLSSAYRLSNFKNEWQVLLNDKFEKKSSKFEKHYSSVVRRALNTSTDFYKPAQAAEQWVVKDSSTQQSQVEIKGVPAENKFIQESLNVKFQRNAPPILMVQGKKDFDVSTNNDSSQQHNYYQHSIKDQMKAYSSNMNSYKKLIKSHRKSVGSRTSNKRSNAFKLEETAPRINEVKGATSYSFYQMSPKQSFVLQESFHGALDNNNSKRPVSSTMPNRRNLISSYSHKRNNYLVAQQIKSSSSQARYEEVEKLKKTNIEEIDKYYKSINNLSEIQRIQFITEYQRLYDQIKKIWNACKIPPQEQNWVNSYLQKKVDMNHFENPLFLKKLNNYILYMQKYVQLKTSLRNIYDDRESYINRIKHLAQKNNFYLMKNHGVSYLINLRNLTIKLLQTNSLYQRLCKNKNKELKIERDECYLCFIKNQESSQLNLVSQILKQLGYFISDYLFYIPKTQQVIDLQLKQDNYDNQLFSPQEVSAFEIICSKLRKGVSEKRNLLEKSLQLLINHNCSQQSDYISQLEQEYMDEEHDGIHSNYLRFNWKIEEIQEQTQSRKNLNERIKKAYENLSKTSQQDTINIHIDKEANINQSINMFQNEHNDSLGDIQNKLQQINIRDISYSNSKDNLQEPFIDSKTNIRKMTENQPPSQDPKDVKFQDSQRTYKTYTQIKQNNVQIMQDYTVPSQYRNDTTEKLDNSSASNFPIRQKQSGIENKSSNREIATEMKSYKEYRILEELTGKERSSNSYKKVKSLIKVYQPMEIQQRPSSNAVSKRRIHQIPSKEVQEIYLQQKQMAKTPLNVNQKSHISSESFLERLNREALNQQSDEKLKQ